MSNQTAKFPQLTAVNIFSISLTVITAAFHVIGIFTLICLRSKLSQTSILINLSISEMLYCLFSVTWPIKSLKYARQCLCLFSMLSNKMLMMVLLGDRFLEIYLNIKYPIIVTRERLFKTIGIIWVVGGLYGIIPVVATDKSQYYRTYYINNYLALAFDAVFTISALFTYGYFFLKIRKIHRKVSSNRSAENSEGSGRRFNFRIPFSIVATYIVFNVSSAVLHLTNHYTKRAHAKRGVKCTYCPSLVITAYTLAVIGFLSDPILYIFMQRNVRLLIRRRIWPLNDSD